MWIVFGFGLISFIYTLKVWTAGFPRNKIPSNILDKPQVEATYDALVKFGLLVNLTTVWNKFIFGLAQKFPYGPLAKMTGENVLVRRMRQRRKMFASMMTHENSKIDYNLLSIDEKLRVQTRFVNGVRCIIVWNSETFSETPDYKKAVFYYHGGGWVVGEPQSSHLHALQMICLEMRDYVIIAPDYHKAPEFSFYDGEKTGFSAFLDCYNMTKYFVNVYKIENYVLMGDSAGGNLTTAVALKISENVGDFYEIPTLIAPIYPAYQGINFQAESFLDSDLPSLSRKSVDARGIFEIAF